MLKKFALFAAVFVVGMNNVSAADAAASSEEAIRSSLAKIVPDLVPDNIAPSAVPGLYEVVYGANVFYVSGDGRYLLQGTLVDLVDQKDLTEPTKAAARLRALDTVGEENMVVFGPEVAKHTITVFTDIDCPYCRKLHQEMDAMNAEGIRVRYMLYPRAGVGSPSYKKAVTVWCSDDRQKALTASKNGEELPEKDCDNPVKQHLMIGDMVGVHGTPAIITDTGELISGYVPAKRLAAMLDSSAQKASAGEGKASQAVEQKTAEAAE